MAQPYVGEIRMFAGTFAPAGWEFCSGQLLPISENDTLFVVLGTTYGGDGDSTFGLPDLRGRIPIHQGSGFVLGESGGVEEVTLSINQIPNHTHPLWANGDIATATSPQNNVPAAIPSASTLAYGTDAPPVILHSQTVGAVGSTQPHTNLQPYLCIRYIISLYGLYPQPN